jgi:hypothetical protein
MLHDVNMQESRDVVIVSCDLVTQHPLFNLLNDFRRHEAGVAALFFPCVPDPVPGATPGPKSKQKPGTYFSSHINGELVSRQRE